MSFRKTGLGAGIAAAVLTWAGSAYALPQDYQLGMQPAVTPVMERIESFHTMAVAMKTAAKVVGVKIKWGGDFKGFFDGPHYELA